MAILNLLMVRRTFIVVLCYEIGLFVLAGWYWIDPNLGMVDDAIYVFCNMSAEGETCVFPDIHSSTMPNIPWRKNNNRNDWYSNLRGGFKVSVEGNWNNEFFLNILDNIRNNRSGSNDFLEAVVPGCISELYIHLHQQCCLVQFEKLQIRFVHQITGRK